MKSKILIGNISDDTNEAVLRQLLVQKLGHVIAVTIPKDPKTGKHRGYAIVEMSSNDQADRAMNLNGFPLDGRPLAITVAERSKVQRKWYKLGAQ